MPDFKATFQTDKPMAADFGETNVIGDEILIPGPQGPQGPPGEPGKDGYTPVKGVDYFTPEEVQEVAEQAAEMVEVPEVNDGVTPHIGANGNWWIGDDDTGVCADARKGDLKFISERSIFTEDNVIRIEFDGLDNYSEAVMVVFAPYNDKGECTATMHINDMQVDKDFYNFQHSTNGRFNMFRVKKFGDGVYYTEVVYRSEFRYMGGFALNGVWSDTTINGTTKIRKIAFNLSKPLTACSDGRPAWVKFYAG